MSSNGHHQSKGYGLRDYHKNMCKQLVEIFKGNNKHKIGPEDLQSLFELWENDKCLPNGTCMTFREYGRTLVQPYIQDRVKVYWASKERRAAGSELNSKSEEYWDSFEDFLRDYMGDKYYNKI